MKKCLIAVFILFSEIPLYAQISGIVSDAVNNLPLEKVQLIQNRKLITTTNTNGRFTLPRSVASDTITFRRLGYQTKRVRITDTDTLLVIIMKPQNIEISDVVIRGYNTTQQAFSSSGAVDILSAKQIRSMSGTSPAPVLNSVPGIYMHSGARNTNRITMRGIGSRSMYTTTKIKAYLNSIPLTSGIGETTLEDLDLDLIDRITVMKGPSSSAYGAPLGGTILYRMGVPSTTGTSVKQEVTMGSFNMLKSTSSLSWKNEYTGLALSYNKLFDKGFRENDNYRRDGLTGIFRHQITENVDVTYLGRFHKLKAYIPSSISKETFLSTPWEAAENWKSVNGNETYRKILNGLSFNIVLNDNFRNETSLFLKNYDGKEIRPFNILDDRTMTAGGRSLFERKWNLAQWQLTSQAGYEYLSEYYNWKIFETLSEGHQGELLNKNSQIRSQHNLFGTLEVQYKKFGISSGININKTDYRYKDLSNDEIDYSDQKKFQWILSPRLSLTYKSSDQLMFFGSLSHGFSAPSYEETLNAQGFVDGSIKPETGWNREIGIRARYWNNRLFFKSSAYSIAVKDLLVTKRPAEDKFYKINAGETLHNGIEAMSRIRWLESSFISSTVNINYTHSNYRFTDFNDEGNDYSGNYLPGIPKNKLSVELSANLPYGSYLEAHWLSADQMPMNDANTLFSDSYNRLNLKVGLNRSVAPNWRIDVYGGINNIADNHYASMILINAPSYGGSSPRYYYPAEPRNYFAGISLHYSFNNKFLDNFL